MKIFALVVDPCLEKLLLHQAAHQGRVCGSRPFVWLQKRVILTQIASIAPGFFVQSLAHEMLSAPGKTDGAYPSGPRKIGPSGLGVGRPPAGSMVIPILSKVEKGASLFTISRLVPSGPVLKISDGRRRSPLISHI